MERILTHGVGLPKKLRDNGTERTYLKEVAAACGIDHAICPELRAGAQMSPGDALQLATFFEGRHRGFFVSSWGLGSAFQS